MSKRSVEVAGRTQHPLATAGTAKRSLAIAGVTKRSLAIAFFAGAASVAGFSPLDWPVVALAAFAVLQALWRGAPSPVAASALGGAFGLGLFLAGVSWVYVSLSRFGGMPAPLAGFATLAFCAVLAFYPALAGWLQASCRPRGPANAGWPALIHAGLVVPSAWLTAEWLRGVLFTGFPWIAIGYVATDTPIAGFAPLAGVAACGFAFVALAGMLLEAFLPLRAGTRPPENAPRLVATASAAILLITGELLRGPAWTAPTGEAFRAALLQGNIPQDLKFDPQRFPRTVETYAELAAGADARLIVLPETALPRFLHELDPVVLERFARIGASQQADLVVGIPIRDTSGAYYNSAISLGTSPGQRYDKSHLVPFGEFIPPGFGWVLRWLAIPLSDFTAGREAQPPLALGDQRIAVNICYEDAFGEAIRRAARDATLIVNLSNVAWFGESLAPAQHLQIARMRAIETGRMVLTSTNSGITAAIDRSGRVIGRLESFSAGRLSVSVHGYEGNTPYMTSGDVPLLVLAIVVIIVAFLVARRVGARPA